MRPVGICLWFDDQAEEAAKLYCSVFEGAKITATSRYRGEKVVEVSGKPEGSVLTVAMEIGGMRLMLLNGGPQFTPNEAVSLTVACESQEEIDRIWEALTSGGGEESQCGWLKDRYGFSWQVTPARLEEFMAGDPDQVARVTDAFMGMKKFDIATLEAAARGEGVAAG